MSEQRLMLISSDGHATARMEDYRDYLDPEFRDEFEAFLGVHHEHGSYNYEPKAMELRLDREVIDEWVHDVLDAGRTQGHWNPSARLAEMERHGICAEVLIPDFGLPFELLDPTLSHRLNLPRRTRAQTDAANRAYNRWLADFCSSAPERFAGMAMVSFWEVDSACEGLRRAKESGLSGVMLPMFDEDDPLFGPRFDPVWDAIEELDMPVTSHISISGTSTRVWHVDVPHPACFGPIYRGPAEFFCRQVLDHMIWGGVFERHPRLKVAFTEQGSGWLPGKLAAMDHSYENSFMRRDIREVVKQKPSQYFTQNCWVGASLLSRTEVLARHEIGVDKMMVGADYPHHEGTWRISNIDYLQATFGGTGIPVAEARKLLGENAVAMYGFDRGQLRAVVDRVGPLPQDVLAEAPDNDKFPRGDVHKPLTGSLV